MTTIAEAMIAAGTETMIPIMVTDGRIVGNVVDTAAGLYLHLPLYVWYLIFGSLNTLFC